MKKYKYVLFPSYTYNQILYLMMFETIMFYD